MITIFVEGAYDEKFINSIIKQFCHIEAKFMIINCKGWQGIKLLRNNMRQNKDKGGKNFIIFDADDNPTKRREEILNLIGDPSIVDDIFLVPNNNDEGNLDTLLLNITRTSNSLLNNCFDKYRECINSLGNGYKIPDDKTKVFAHLSGLGKPYQIEKINYLDEDIWDLNHPLVKNLIVYLDRILY